MTLPIKLNEIQARILYFRLITALLCEPEEDVTHNDELYIQLRQCLNVLNPDLIRLLDELQEKAGGNIKDLLVEYSRLFVGPFKLPAPPYASCYLGSKELNNEITDWVRQFYETSGLVFDYNIVDLPDHIAVETEFLYYLLTQQIRAATDDHTELESKYGERYTAFLENHHSRWVPLLSQKVIDASMHPFYKILFRMIREMLPYL